MDPQSRWVIHLSASASLREADVGGKAAALGRLLADGWRVPPGFVVTTQTYRRFLRDGDLERIIMMELGRKSLDDMRWEEIWDTALRLRNHFLATEPTVDLASTIGEAALALGDVDLVVRSSAPGEDGRDTSFAGLHESIVGVRGPSAVIDAVRVVWSSLWSDAALLYRRELGLDPARSSMAVLIQPLVKEDRSGVAFARDPRQPSRETMVVEAVPGLCRDLVDGAVDPDRWLLHRETGDVMETRRGDRGPGSAPLLDGEDLEVLRRTVLDLEARMGWPPDVEWTGRRDALTVLQVRPITSAHPPAASDADDKRPWYLSLRPGAEQLRQLRQRVAEILIPELTAAGDGLAAEPLELLDDGALSRALGERVRLLEHWRRVYWRDFIPFAHGARRLAVYYNDAVRPRDPYEFVGLLAQEDRLASRRNGELRRLAAVLRSAPQLRRRVDELVTRSAGGLDPLAELDAEPDAAEFRLGLTRLLSDDFDIAFDGHRLLDDATGLLRVLLQLAEAPPPGSDATRHHGRVTVDELEKQLFTTVGPERAEEARDVLGTARLSWRLRDDDNLLLGRLESQLLRAVELAAQRMRDAGRLGAAVDLALSHAEPLAEALIDPAGHPVVLPAVKRPPAVGRSVVSGVSARQLTGQPGAPGLASGSARCIRTAADLVRFRAGEVLVCDAIQPTMTHLVPLASAVVERRGGMLIHGVIVARELGLPCVNGIPRLLDQIRDGDLLTVDGYLGIVTIGDATLDLELGTVQ